MDTQTQDLIDQYIAQLSPAEKNAYNIAVKNLESSFDMEKSIGFLEFKKQQEQSTSKSTS